VATKPQTICLDPGHGGADPGAVERKITERDINLTVALQVRKLLEAQGYGVFMTRTTNDPSLVNADRYNYCNQKHATILVSIHHNFFSDASVDHDTALYFKPTDLSLATSLVDATSTQLGLLNNGIAQFEDGVLSKSTMPAALSEGFFLTSSTEYDALRAPGSTRLADEAAGIAKGIVNYFTAPPSSTPASGTVPQVLNRDE
jgi:N-acetylmuramoyl-L-alanine amidase